MANDNRPEGARPPGRHQSESMAGFDRNQVADIIRNARPTSPESARNDYTMSDNPITQCLEMIDEIRAGTFKMENGRPVPLAGKEIPAFCYVICDITPTLEKVLKHYDAQRMPDGNGYYNFHKASHAYIEVMDYDKVLNDSKKRNRVFFDKLNIRSQ